MSDNAELDGWEDIDNNGGTIGTGINKAIHRLVIAIFNSGSKTSHQLIYLKDKIEELNKNLKDASGSSANLATSLNRLTLFGVLIALLGIISQLGQFLYLNHLWPFPYGS